MTKKYPNKVERALMIALRQLIDNETPDARTKAETLLGRARGEFIFPDGKPQKRFELIDLTGKVFGRLTVVERSESINGVAAWHCRCECGGVKDVRGTSLRAGGTKSCGCLTREAISRMHQRPDEIDLAKNWKCRNGKQVTDLRASGNKMYGLTGTVTGHGETMWTKRGENIRDTGLDLVADTN